MKPKNDNDGHLESVAQALDKAKTQSAGKPAFRGIALDDAMAVLPHLLRFHDELTDLDRRAVISQACFECARLPSITATALSAAIKAKQAELLKRSPKRFLLSSSISVEVHRIRRKGTWAGSKIAVLNTLPTWVSRASTLRELKFQGVEDTPRSFARVLVETYGRTSASAFQRGLFSLDLLRGVWNFYENWKTPLRWSSGHLPVNSFRRGRIHVLHEMDGTEVPHALWQEPDWSWHSSPKKLNDAIQLRRAEMRVSRLLRSIPYAANVERMIVGYSRALDENDYRMGLVGLWATLEEATGGSDHATVVKRGAFLWKNVEYGKAVLDGLRELRNQAVHTSQAEATSERQIYALKRHVEQVIWFHLQNGRTFKNFGDACDFLSLPSDTETLKKRVRQASRALRWRE